VKSNIYFFIILIFCSGCFQTQQKSEVEFFSNNQRSPSSIGEVLYKTNCSSCHGALAESEKIGYSAVQIEGAITHIPEMNNISSLRALTQTEIQYISDVLNLQSNNRPNGALKYKQILGGRKYIISKLSFLFAGQQSSPNEIEIMNIMNDIRKEPGFIGGKATHFEIYSGEGVTEKQADADSPIHPLPGVPRRGIITKTCQEVLSYDVAVTNVLSIINTGNRDEANQNNLNALFELMNPTTQSNPQIVNQLLNLFNAAQNEHGLTRPQAWKYVIYSLCISPTFELL
jgi:hypothetical protein